jgi:ABC-2 type transport system ATP-binding protein
MNEAIRVEGLTYRPGRGFALRDISLSVPTGSVYGFLGPNGAGKTTTIKLILGLLETRQGEIRCLGQRIPHAAHKALARIGYVPEAPHLYQSLKVSQAIQYHSAFYETWDADLARQLLGKFELREHQRLSGLSKGEQRKLMILLALAQRPTLLMLDEPTDGLDPVVRREILDALRESVEHEGTTVFVSSHLVHELEGICDWVAVVDRGSVVAQMPMVDFRDRIKLLQVSGNEEIDADAPFEVLRRSGSAGTEGGQEWVVSGWQPEMREYFAARGAAVKGVVDLSLEDGFVELLRSFRRSEGR